MRARSNHPSWAKLQCGSMPGYAYRALFFCLTVLISGSVVAQQSVGIQSPLEQAILNSGPNLDPLINIATPQELETAAPLIELDFPSLRPLDLQETAGAGFILPTTTQPLGATNGVALPRFTGASILLPPAYQGPSFEQPAFPTGPATGPRPLPSPF